MIQIHNIMEEQVIKRVHEIYDQVSERINTGITCDCENCRMDTANYVLNRIPPHYVVSGRGYTHSTDVLKNPQTAADIEKLIIEGMHLVSAAKRPYHKVHRTSSKKSSVPQFVFNFPSFAGTVYDGSTFEPVTDAEILLKLEGKPAKMTDVTWPNPVRTYESTKGNYTFNVEGIESQKEGELKKFTFTVEVKAPSYEDTSFSFTVPLYSESTADSFLNTSYSVKIQDVILFKKGGENSYRDQES